MGVISSDERKVGLHQWSEYLHKEVLTWINRRLPRHDTLFTFIRMVLIRTIVKPRCKQDKLFSKLYKINEIIGGTHREKTLDGRAHLSTQVCPMAYHPLPAPAVELRGPCPGTLAASRGCANPHDRRFA